jgi:hypothetical protein
VFGILTRFDVHSTATLMLLAIIVGAGTGLAAVLFIKAIGALAHFSFEQGEVCLAESFWRLTARSRL